VAAASRAAAVVGPSADRAELALDGVDLADEGLEHAVLGAVLVDEIVAADLGGRLEGAVDAAVALLEARGVPGDVDVEQVGAVGLEVDALAGGVGGDQDAHRVLVGIGVEGVLDLLAGLVAHAAVEHEDALVGAVGAGDGLGEEVLIIALGITVLGEENDATGRPGALVRGQVARVADAGGEGRAQPGEQGPRLAVGLAAGLLGEGAHALQEVGGLGGGGGQGGRGGAHLGVLLGGERLLVDAVGLGVVAELGLDRADLDAAGLVDRGGVDLERAGERLGAR
jgi:hypothetical protein